MRARGWETGEIPGGSRGRALREEGDGSGKWGRARRERGAAGARGDAGSGRRQARAEQGQAGGERAGEERELGRVVRVEAGPSGETNWAWVCIGPGSGVGWVSWAGFGFLFSYSSSF